MTARPTQYQHTVFKSKSEAILARAISRIGWYWEYEPDDIEVGEWKPDFWIIAPSSYGGFSSMILEYKPCPPTDTYKAELLGRFYELGRVTGYSGQKIINPWAEFGLFVCDPFEMFKPITLEIANIRQTNGIKSAWENPEKHQGYWFQHLGVTMRNERDFRFDLENSKS